MTPDKQAGHDKSKEYFAALQKYRATIDSKSDAEQIAVAKDALIIAAAALSNYSDVWCAALTVA